MNIDHPQSALDDSSTRERLDHGVDFNHQVGNSFTEGMKPCHLSAFQNET